MVKDQKKITMGWVIPREVKEKFVNFCAEKGTIAQEDCAGALIIWPSLSADVREEAKMTAKGLLEDDYLTEENGHSHGEVARVVRYIKALGPADAFSAELLSKEDLDAAGELFKLLGPFLGGRAVVRKARDKVRQRNQKGISKETA